MDTLSPSLVLFYDRPLLGAVAFAACLAGGTATHDASAGGPKFDAATPRPGPISYAARIAPAAPSLAPTAAAPKTAFALPKADLAARAAKVSAIAPVTPASTTTAAALDLTLVKPRAVKAAPDALIPTPTRQADAVPLASAPVIAAIEVAPTPAAAQTASLAAVMTVPVETLIPPKVAPAASAPLELVSSPELRRFDLANFRSPSAPKAKLAASRKTAAIAGRSRTSTRVVDEVLFRQTGLSIGGHPSGEVAVRIGPDMKPSIKVGDLLGVVSAQMDADALARFNLASSASEYVTFAQLRSAGLDVQYNAGSDSIAISVAP